MDEDTLNVLSIFIHNLTGSDDTKIKGYVSEIALNREFHNQLDRKGNNVGRKQYRYWHWGISTILGMAVYSLCRMQKPEIVVETGVSSGVSSSYILCALEENKIGELYSIDLQQSGWLIPDYLRHRWHFIQGESSQKLAPLLEEVGQTDLFLHDSEHTYRNMLWEFQTAWLHLKAGGFLLSHNIDVNNAFSDFCKRVGVQGCSLEEMGGMVKPN
jgi:hypothetical protein